MAAGRSPRRADAPRDVVAPSGSETDEVQLKEICPARYGQIVRDDLRPHPGDEATANADTMRGSVWTPNRFPVSTKRRHHQHRVARSFHPPSRITSHSAADCRWPAAGWQAA